MTQEEEIYALIGAIVAKWNYVERCVRQITRQQIPGGRLGDAYHFAISKLKAYELEDRLKDHALPKWRGSPGEVSLRGLIDAISIARAYRNHFVHGFSEAVPGPNPCAIISETKPKRGMIAMSAPVPLSDLKSVVDHIGNLGAFAQEVMVAFDTKGQPAKDSDGALVVEKPRPPIKPLPKLNIQYFEVPPPLH